MADLRKWKEINTLENGFFPLYVQNQYFPLPEELPYWNQPIEIILISPDNEYKIQEIQDFVNFQYQHLDQKFVITDSEEDETNGSISFIKQRQVESTSSLNTLPIVVRTTDDPFNILPKCLKMIFSLAPKSKIKLLLYQASSDFKFSDVYQFIFDSLRILQSSDRFTDAICLMPTVLASGWYRCGIKPTPEFYYHYLEGEPSTCFQRKVPIRIPIFANAGQKEWIINGLYEQNYYNYNFCWYTLNYICQVGGIVFRKPLENEESKSTGDNYIKTCFNESSSGFCYPEYCQKPLSTSCFLRFASLFYPTPYKDCTSITETQNYQTPFSLDLGLNIYNKTNRPFRIPDVSHFAGPYQLSLDGTEKDIITETYLSSIIFGVQYAQMKRYFNFPSEAFLRPMYDKQYEDGILFHYVRDGKITIPSFNRMELINSPTEPYNECDLEDYRLFIKNYGMNPCGLGYPNWKSESWNTLYN